MKAKGEKALLGRKADQLIGLGGYGLSAHKIGMHRSPSHPPQQNAVYWDCVPILAIILAKATLAGEKEKKKQGLEIDLGIFQEVAKQGLTPHSMHPLAWHRETSRKINSALPQGLQPGCALRVIWCGQPRPC